LKPRHPSQARDQLVSHPPLNLAQHRAAMAPSVKAGRTKHAAESAKVNSKSDYKKLRLNPSNKPTSPELFHWLDAETVQTHEKCKTHQYMHGARVARAQYTRMERFWNTTKDNQETIQRRQT
jgi:hypothetical protein